MVVFWGPGEEEEMGERVERGGRRCVVFGLVVLEVLVLLYDCDEGRGVESGDDDADAGEAGRGWKKRDGRGGIAVLLFES